MGTAELREKFEKQYLIMLTDSVTSLQNAPDYTLQKWIDLVLADLTAIEATSIGNLLLRSIAFHRKVVMIQALWGSPLSPGMCNAQTGPEPDLGAFIQYTPNYLGPGSRCDLENIQKGGYSILSNETLFHELVHALRWSSGKNNKGVVTDKGLVFYGNKEEFIAVVVQGIYGSARGRPVRASHTGRTAIDPELNGSYKFYAVGSEAYKFMKEFCMENAGFTGALAQFDVPFNPVRAYYEKPAVAKSISERSPIAKRRDAIMPIAKAARDFILEEIDNYRVWKANHP